MNGLFLEIHLYLQNEPKDDLKHKKKKHSEPEQKILKLIHNHEDE